MALVTQTYKIDLVPDTSKTVVIHASLLDSSRHIVFELYNNGKPYIIPPNTTAYVEGKKAKGTFFNKQITVGNGQVEFDLDHSMTDSVGPNNCRLLLRDINEKEIGSSGFLLHISEGGVIDGVNLYNTSLGDYMTKVQTYENETRTYRDEAKTSATTAGNHAVAAGTSEKNAKTSENRAKQSETNAATSEQHAKTSETNAKTSETNAKSSETKAKISENNAKTSEEIAKTWAVGPSAPETRGTDTNNAKYWAEQARSVAQIEVGSKTQTGLLRVGENLDSNNGTVSVKTASKTDKGVVKVGINIDVASDGTISVKTASTSAKGLVQVGTNIDNNNGTISVKTASKQQKGLMQVGTGFNVDGNGVVDVSLGAGLDVSAGKIRVHGPTWGDLKGV